MVYFSDKKNKQMLLQHLRYLDDLLKIDHHYLAQMVSQIYPTELQMNKANPSDTEAPVLDLDFGRRLVHYKWHSFNQTL